MKILNLTLHNFKSFSDTYLDFTNDIPIGFTHLQGNIGAGKTSLGEAILYGLYGRVRNKNNNQLLSWGSKSGYVKISLLDKHHQPLTIFRELRYQGQSEFIVTKSDGSIIDGSSKMDIQKTLEENHYDVPGHIMDMFCIISFNNFKSLSQLSSKDTKILLDELLCMNEINPVIDKIKQQISNHRLELVEIEAKIKTISTINQQNESKIKEYNQQLLELLKQQTFIKEEEYKYYPSITTSMLLEQHKTQKISKLNEKQAELKILQKNGKLLKGKSTCPTCHHPLDPHSIDSISKETETLKLDIEELQGVIENITKSIEQYKQNYRDNFETPLNEVNKKISNIQQHIKLLENQHSIHHPTEDLNPILLNSKKEQIEKEQISLNELLTQLQTQVRKQIIAHFTPIINQKIINYTSQLQLNYIPFFNDNFDCLIKTPMGEIVEISSLSTGQTKLVDMVVILSIITTILHNNHINVIFLDELFTNLNKEIKYKLIEILKRELQDKQIIAISHEQFPEYLVDKIININYKYPHSELIIL